MASYLRYLAILCGTLLIPSIVVVGANYRIGAIGWATPETATAAVRWQRTARGIVNMTSVAVVEAQDRQREAAAG